MKRGNPHAQTYVVLSPGSFPRVSFSLSNHQQDSEGQEGAFTQEGVRVQVLGGRSDPWPQQSQAKFSSPTRQNTAAVAAGTSS